MSEKAGFSTGWSGKIPNCPNCGGEVHVGIMSLKATCKGTQTSYCGWWWDDSADGKRWNPTIERQETADFSENEERWVKAFREQAE